MPAVFATHVAMSMHQAEFVSSCKVAMTAWLCMQFCTTKAPSGGWAVTAGWDACLRLRRGSSLVIHVKTRPWLEMGQIHRPPCAQDGHIHPATHSKHSLGTKCCRLGSG